MTEVQEEIEAAAEDILSVADYLKDALDAGDEIYESKWLDPLMRVHGLLLASGLPAAIEARDKALERVKAAEALIQKHTEQFEHYEKQHRAKIPAWEKELESLHDWQGERANQLAADIGATTAKAVINRDLALQARAFLSRISKEQDNG